MRRSLTSLMVIILAVAAASGLRGASAADPRPTTVYVGAVAGHALTSQVVAVLSPTDSLDSFDLTLSYDASLLAPDRVDLAAHWTAATDIPPASQPGELEIRASTLTECTAGSTCSLGNVTWKAIGDGTTSVDVMQVTLQNHGVALLDVDSVPGEVQTGAANGGAAMPSATSGTAAADATNSVAGVRSSGGGSSSLGGGLVLLLVALVAVAGAAILAAVFITALARRSWHWSGNRKNVPEAGATVKLRTEPLPLAAAALGPKVQEYLSQVEAFGMVAANLREDQFMREVALLGTGAHGQSNGQNGASDGERNQAAPADQAEATK